MSPTEAIIELLPRLYCQFSPAGPHRATEAAGPSYQMSCCVHQLFHATPAVGESLVTWLEDLPQSGTLTPPKIRCAEGFLGGANAALETLRSIFVSRKRSESTLVPSLSADCSDLYMRCSKWRRTLLTDK